MSRHADFGPTPVLETDVDLAVIETLQLWLPTYLRQFEIERDIDSSDERQRIVRPQNANYDIALEDEGFPSARLPGIIVTTASPQSIERSHAQDGNGDTYDVAWSTAVSVVARGPSKTDARILAAQIGGAVRRCLCHQNTLGGFAGDVMWQPPGSVLPIRDITAENRELAMALNTFIISTDDALRGSTGPLIPAQDPYEDPDPSDPETPYEPVLSVGSVTVSVTGRPITDD